MHVYGLINNGDLFYVGSAVNKKEREAEHKRASIKGMTPVYCHIRNVGSFEMVTLCETDNLEELYILEGLYILHYRPLCNVALPGFGDFDINCDICGCEVKKFNYMRHRLEHRNPYGYMLFRWPHDKTLWTDADKAEIEAWRGNPTFTNSMI